MKLDAYRKMLCQLIWKVLLTAGAVLLTIPPALANPQISVGSHKLRADTSGQEIEIRVTGNSLVQGLNLNVQIGASLANWNDHPSVPEITDLRLLDIDMIFFPNHAYVPSDLDGQYPNDQAPFIEFRSIVTESGEVTTDGVLARVVINTSCRQIDGQEVCFSCGSQYPLILAPTYNGDSEFAGNYPPSFTLPIDITDGTITIACDTDGDGIDNDIDNCPLLPNASQTDTDSDGDGDTCDADDDDDTINDDTDNCPLVSNTNQTNTDSDANGDACDLDDDNDTVNDDADNCPLVSNSNQVDIDSDGKGDACDADDDGDGVNDDSDNCPQVSNPGQEDGDLDSIGDACEPNRLPPAAPMNFRLKS